MSEPRPPTVVKVLPTQWIEVNHQGRKYLCGVENLLSLFIKEKENGKSNDESTDRSRTHTTGGNP